MSVYLQYAALGCETNASQGADIQYLEYSDGSVEWRKGVRDGRFVYDMALTPLGFDGVEDFDWENVIIY